MHKKNGPDKTLYRQPPSGQSTISGPGNGHRQKLKAQPRPHWQTQLQQVGGRAAGNSLILSSYTLSGFGIVLGEQISNAVSVAPLYSPKTLSVLHRIPQEVSFCIFFRSSSPPLLHLLTQVRLFTQSCCGQRVKSPTHPPGAPRKMVVPPPHLRLSRIFKCMQLNVVEKNEPSSKPLVPGIEMSTHLPVRLGTT